MTALAAGFGAAMAGGPDEANAQATELRIDLETGGQVVFDMRDFGFETQAGIIDRLTACIEAGENPRDVCVGQIALELQTQRLGEVVRETRAVLLLLESEIGIPMQDLIREPVFCEYAPEQSEVQACSNAVETARLAGLDLQIAQVRAQRLELAAQADAGRERVAALAEQADAGRERVAALAAEADANRAVLAVLRQIADEEAAQTPAVRSGS